MAVALLPYRQPRQQFCRLADYPLDSVLWPLDRAEGDTLGDLNEHDHVVMYSSSRAYTASFKGLRCRVSLMLMEPPAIQSRWYKLLRWIYPKFYRVLTHNSDLLQRIPNARFVPHGGTFLRHEFHAAPPKQRRISLIASLKKDTVGHRLRHRLAEWSRQASPDLQLYGYGYNPIDDKSVAHAPYWFSVVVENSRVPGYFTEKLIDSLLCRSLPIYWGAPDIAHFFDHRGMIVCHDEWELRDAIQSVNVAEYQRRLPFLEENRRRALNYLDFHLNSANLLVEEDQLIPAVQGSPQRELWGRAA